MKAAIRRWWVAGLVAGLLAVLPGCTAWNALYESDDTGGDDDANYYETGIYDYPHWPLGYHVAPPPKGQEPRQQPVPPRPRPAEPRQVPPRGPQSAPSYRPAPSTRSAPSIPSGSRPSSGSRSH